MAKKGAPYGNKNAMGPHDKGYLSGTVGGAFGGLGSTVSGIYTGVSKSSVGMKKHNRAATTVGALGGALTSVTTGAAALGGLVAANKGGFFNKSRNAKLGALGTIAAGAAVGAGVNYAGAKIGQYFGKRATSNYKKKSK